MSNARGHKGFAPLIDVSAVGRAVNAAIKTAPRPKKPWGPLPAKVRRAMQGTKAQQEAARAKFAAAFVHVQYHIQPVDNGFEVWDTASSSVMGWFPTFRAAKAYVERVS